MSRVTVVIPNYNGAHLLRKCLPTLQNQTYSDYMVQVIDNASVDESRTLLEEEYPWVETVYNSENLGFSGAVNQGIRMCKSEFVLLLNNDTEVEPNFVEEMVKSISSSKKIFSASSRMVNYWERELIDDAGDLYNVLGWQLQRGRRHPITEYETPCDVFSACAGAAIYRTALFRKVGYFDEAHFAYLEDIDVGFRARIKGYRNVYCPKAIVYHMGSATSGTGYTDFKVRLSGRNSIYLVYKNMPFLMLLVNAPALLLGYLVNYIMFRKEGFGRAYIDGIKEGLRTAKKNCKVVSFSAKNLVNYVKIEIELLRNAFIFLWEHTGRK